MRETVEKAKAVTDAEERKAREAMRALTAVRAHQRYAQSTGMKASEAIDEAIVDLIKGLERLCDRERLELRRLLLAAGQNAIEAPARVSAEASDEELAAALRGIRDAYAVRLPATDRKRWRAECDELAGWFGEENQ